MERRTGQREGETVCLMKKPLVYTVSVEDIFKLARKPMGLKTQPLKDFILGSSPNVNRKLLTHPNKCTHTPTHPPAHTQTSELGKYNKLNLWLSLKIQI